MTIQAVRAQIRFQLEQLKTQNKHHGFEDIAREFTRQRICRNLLTATGPVGSGGDQGRDFETYKTYLDESLEIKETKLFEGVSKNGNVFFACSLQENIVSKIKSDIKSIFSHTDEKRPITYFCVEDIPVAKRNKLINWCKDEYQVDLQIFDGQALSENLSDPDIFWIGEQYLHISSEIYPKPTNGDEWYIEYRERWIESDNEPYNFSDFHEIKYGLRKATWSEKLKPDLPAWINAIQKFFDQKSDYMTKKVQYEVCVAALRGQNNLTAYKDTVIQYFKDIDNIEDPSELTDVGVLLMYCSGAQHLGGFDVEASYLNKLSQKYMARVDHFLDNVEGANTRCLLLENKARAYMLPHLESEEPSKNLDKAFEYWNELVDLVEQAVLFPLEHFSDTLGALTPAIGTDPRFLEITDKVDQLLAKRVGGFAAAEKCRDRAIAFHNNGQTLLAIDHLHRAKINWFSAETLRGTIVASRFIAEAYSNLGLMYAAKYYLLSASYLAFHSKDDDVRDHISKSFFQTAEICYKSGEWLTFFPLMELALLSHHHYDHQPLDIVEHESLMRVFFCGTIVRALSQRFWPEANEHVEKKFINWPLDNETREELTKLIDEQDKNSYWKKAPLEDIWLQIEENLSGKPFSDVGEQRVIGWKALGIEWEVCFSNSYEITRVAEEFVAVLQIALADFAMNDLQLLPVKVKINALLSEGNEIKVIEKFDNARLEWDIEIPHFVGINSPETDDRTPQTLAYAISVLGYCTTLPQESFQEKIEAAFENGLANKTFFARPYPEMYKEVIAPDMFMEKEKNELESIEVDRHYNFHEHEELAWCDNDGIFFDGEEAELHAQNRYNRLSQLMKVVWPKILSNKEYKSYFEKLKSRGYLDWHLSSIACNAVANHVANKIVWAGTADEQYMQELQKTIMSIINGDMKEEIEKVDIDKINVQEFKIQEEISFVSIMKTWGLVIHSPVPNFQALRVFMAERYKVFQTDVPHDNLFE